MASTWVTKKYQLLLSSEGATLKYYETCIKTASNLHHDQKEVAVSPEEPEFLVKARRVETLFLFWFFHFTSD